ncbi:MAG: hypothetical protein R2851_00760 [Caldilineaceae bacterium]
MGPLHLLVLAFDKPNFEGWVVEQLDLLRAVASSASSMRWPSTRTRTATLLRCKRVTLDLEERIMIGGIIGGLLGLGVGGEEGAVQGALERMEALAENEFGLDEDDILDIADDLPNDSAALILLSSTRGRSVCKKQCWRPVGRWSPRSARPVHAHGDRRRHGRG